MILCLSSKRSLWNFKLESEREKKLIGWNWLELISLSFISPNSYPLFLPSHNPLNLPASIPFSNLPLLPPQILPEGLGPA
jgi:hypothetical protein